MGKEGHWAGKEEGSHLFPRATGTVPRSVCSDSFGGCAHVRIPGTRTRKRTPYRFQSYLITAATTTQHSQLCLVRHGVAT